MADRSVVYRLSADITQFRAQMAQASAAVKKTATDMTALDKNGATMRRGLDTLGSAAGKVGLVAAAGLGAAVFAAANFDKAMSSVQAATGESAANMDKLREAAIKAGAETAFSASEAAAGIENLAKAGVSTQDILAGGLNGALDLAAAGSVDVAFAAETAATAMTQFGLSGEQVPHIADLLAAAAGKAQGEVADFGAALKQSGLVAAQMGFSIEETTGTLAAFASAGLLGSDAGTSLKTMLLRLANPSAEAANAMDRFGIAAYDAQGNMRPMSDIAQQLAVAFKDQDQATRDAALATIFGSDAIRAANVLYNQGAKGIDAWTNKVNDSGFAAETAATKLDNLAGDFEALKGSLETALIGTGEGSQGPLRSLVQTLTDVTNAYNDLSPAAQGAIGKILGVTALLGGSAWFGAKVVGGVAATKEALSQLGIQAGTTKTALAGIGKGIQFAAIIAGASMLDGALDDLSNKSLDIDNLNRSLEALAKGRVEGSIFETYGEDLDGFATDLTLVNSTLAKVSGGIMDVLPGDAEIHDAEANLAAIDEALAGLVETGQQKVAGRIFDELVVAAEKGGRSLADVENALEQYGIALDNAKGKGGSWLGDVLGAMVPGLESAGAAGKAGAGGLDAFGNAADGATDKVSAFKGALEGLNGMLDKRDALRNYQASLDDFREGFKSGEGFNIDIQGGRENQAMLDGIARSAATVASHLKGLARQEFVNNAIGQLRAMAQNMNLPQREVAVLIAELRELGRQKPTPKVDPETAGAHRELDAVRGKGRDLDNDRYAPTIDGNGAPAFGVIGAVRNELNSLDGSRATVYLVGKRVGDSFAGAFNADGNIHDYYASGGMRLPRIGAQYSQIRANSGKRGLTWSEEGSGPWEAFISGHPGKRDRSRAIAAEVVARLGGQTQFADGGMVQQVQPRVSVSSGPVNVGGTSVRVFLDGRELRGAARVEIEADRRYRDRLDDRD